MRLVKTDPKSVEVKLRSTLQFVALVLLVIGLAWVLVSSNDSGEGTPSAPRAEGRTQ